MKLLAAAIAAIHTCAWAQDSAPASGSGDAARAPTKKLGVVVVTGSQPTSLPTQIPTTTEGLDAKQIERTINATDSEDVLKYFPSLLVRKRYVGDYDHAILSTRASGTGNSARSLVFADGIQLSNLLGNGVGGLSFPPRWGLVTPKEISRVDVMYGPFSAAYSGNSVGAVVDYQTRMPNKFEAHVASNFSYQPFDLYNTHSNYKAWQASASLGGRRGAWSWWLAVNHMDSDGQPLTFANRLLSTGTAGSSGTTVTGAVQGNNNAGQPWWVLGTGTQYHTRQDHAKVKVAYDFSPTVRVSYTFGLWQNDVDNTPESYLRNAAGQPVYSGAINIGGRAFSAVTGGDLSLRIRTARTPSTASPSRATARPSGTGSSQQARTATTATCCGRTQRATRCRLRHLVAPERLPTAVTAAGTPLRRAVRGAPRSRRARMWSTSASVRTATSCASRPHRPPVTGRAIPPARWSSTYAATPDC